MCEKKWTNRIKNFFLWWPTSQTIYYLCCNRRKGTNQEGQTYFEGLPLFLLSFLVFIRQNKILNTHQFQIHICDISLFKKSRIGETKHLLTNADSSTHTTIGWTKNTQKPDFFKAEKIILNAKLKTSRNMPKSVIRPLTKGL